MTSRNKLKLQNVEDTSEEWIWGNHRGGGGAPLKDVYGNSVANLKPVLRGEAEMDYLSPSPSKQKLPRNRHDYDDDPPRNSNKSGKQNNNHPRFKEEEDDNYRRGARGGRASGGGREHHVSDDDYDQRAPRELRLPAKKPPKGGNNARRYEEDVGGSDVDYDNRGSLGPPRGGGVRRDDNRRHNDYNEDSSHYSNQSSQRTNHQSQYQPSSNYIPPNPHSPKKFMSALQELQGVTDREKQEKMKRAMEYQNQLKRQIEEKNRKKEMEKQQEEELKRREYREYMESISPRTRAAQGGDPGFGGGAQKEKKKVPLFKEEREGDIDYPPVHQTRSRDDDYDPPRRSSKPPPAKPGRSVSSHYDDDRDDNNSVNDHSYRQGRGGLNQKSNGNNRNNNNYDSDPDRWHNGREGGNSSLSPNPKTKVVSAQEYDELSKLCDKLLSQQETLQSEIRNQAHLIKELQKKGAVANVNATNKPPNPLLRSKSVQQQRPGNQNNQNNKAPVSERGGGAGAIGGNDARSKSNIRPRPSSMYEGSKQPQVNGHANNSNKPNQSKVEQKKSSKAAFGHAVMNDKMPAGGAHKAPSQASTNQKKPATNAVGAKDRVANKGRDSEGGINGFAKLQAKVHNQPVIVSYEDEDVGASKSSLNLELRGQSRYVPVHESSIDEGDDYSYRGRGGGGGDQLDKLLANTKKGKFA